MTHIELQHLDAIQSVICNDEEDLPDALLVSFKSAAITEHIAIEFGEWITGKELTNDLFKEFIKAKHEQDNP